MLPVLEVSKKMGSDVRDDDRGQKGQLAVGFSLHLQLCRSVIGEHSVLICLATHKRGSPF